MKYVKLIFSKREVVQYGLVIMRFQKILFETQSRMSSRAMKNYLTQKLLLNSGVKLLKNIKMQRMVLLLPLMLQVQSERYAWLMRMIFSLHFMKVKCGGANLKGVLERI